MDFVARAGAMIDRAHRIAGILLICVVVLTLVSMCQLNRNTRLNSQLNDARVRLPVIVVPGATSGLYSPTEDDRLIQMFTNFMAHSINTFTPETMVKQYDTARSFFSPSLLTDSQPYFERKIRDSIADRRSSLFIPDDSSLQVKKYAENGLEIREVTLTGQLSTIIAGTVAEQVPLQVFMKFQKDLVSPANPYGFKLTQYKETPLVNPVAQPVAPGAQSVQNQPQPAPTSP